MSSTKRQKSRSTLMIWRNLAPEMCLRQAATTASRLKSTSSWAARTNKWIMRSVRKQKLSSNAFLTLKRKEIANGASFSSALKMTRTRMSSSTGAKLWATRYQPTMLRSRSPGSRESFTYIMSVRCSNQFLAERLGHTPRTRTSTRIWKNITTHASCSRSFRPYHLPNPIHTSRRSRMMSSNRLSSLAPTTLVMMILFRRYRWVQTF